MNKNKKSTDERVHHFQAALGLAGIQTSDATAHHVLAITDKIREKGGEFNVADSILIKNEIEKMYPEDETNKETANTKKEEEVGEPV